MQDDNYDHWDNSAADYPSTRASRQDRCPSSERNHSEGTVDERESANHHSNYETDGHENNSGFDSCCVLALATSGGQSNTCKRLDKPEHKKLAWRKIFSQENESPHRGSDSVSVLPLVGPIESQRKQCANNNISHNVRLGPKLATGSSSGERAKWHSEDRQPKCTKSARCSLPYSTGQRQG